MSFLDYGYMSLNKKNEELCGDKVERITCGDKTTFVLADGLGSGVKANILSTLTSKILCTMVSAGVSLDECIDTITSSLPVCKVRGVAYSTFTIFSLDSRGEGFLAEFDNPPSVYIREGRILPLEKVKRAYSGKTVSICKISMKKGDQLVMMSDGVVHAGVGQSLNFGWDIKDIGEFCEIHYDDAGSAMTASSVLVNACYSLYAHRPGDDTTVLCVKFMPKKTVNLMIGPPVNPSQDVHYVGEFMAKEGKHIVCGGTSSQVVARVLKKELTASFDFPDREVPPIGYIEGVDLVCEGVLTLKKTLKYALDYASPFYTEIKQFKGRDGASRLADELLVQASDINIFVGRNVNLAHEGLAIDNKSKLDIIASLMKILKGLGKNVEIKYY